MNFLDYAAELAGQIDPHLTAPNPRVGCVIVCDGKIVAQGAHENFGGAHAEVNALKNLKADKRLSTFSSFEWYITLEPCDHFDGKKTPSCTELLLKSKPKKIIVGALDPQFNGKNLKKLRAGGIEVELRKNNKCEALNPFFAHFVKTKLPYLTLKMAQSLDGKISKQIPHSEAKNPKIKYISNELSQRKVHQMRAQYSAILTTVKTILADDPLLNCRLDDFTPLEKGSWRGLNPPVHPRRTFPLFQRGRETSDPQVIVLGKKEDIPTDAKFFLPSPLGGGNEGEGVRKIYFFNTHDLKSVLQKCGEMGIDSILTECGPTVATELLHQGLVDQVDLFVAPEILGRGREGFQQAIPLFGFELTFAKTLDQDVWMRFQKKFDSPKTE